MNPAVKRNLKLVLFVLVVIIFQSTVFNFLKIHNVKPNLLVVSVICYALNQKNIILSAVFGVICGLLLDIFGGNAFGVNAILCMLSAIVSTALSGTFFQGKAAVSLLFICVVGLCYEVLYYVLSIALWGFGSPVYALFDIIFPTVIYNIIISVPVFFFLKGCQAKE